MEVIITEDGSHSLYVPDLDEHYHSTHGAIQESKHVFIQAGLESAAQRFSEINLLEVGFGTGLNCLLTETAVRQMDLSVTYTGIEKYPLNEQSLQQLNYPDLLDEQEMFTRIHSAKWEEPAQLTPRFKLVKRQFDLLADQLLTTNYELIYYDAFGPRAQNEMWSQAVFNKISIAMTKGGILVTYCSKGDVRRAMQAAGLTVEKIPGPPGKREMIRAYRNE